MLILDYIRDWVWVFAALPIGALTLWLCVLPAGARLMVWISQGCPHQDTSGSREEWDSDHVW